MAAAATEVAETAAPSRAASAGCSNSSPFSGCKIYKTAACIIPPRDQWSEVQEIRAKHDRAYRRWMPHVNLMFPFVPEAEFEEAYNHLQSALAVVSPFEVEMGSFSAFRHGKRSTVWLRPDAAGGAVHALQAAVVSALPHCDDLNRRSEEGFTPHLSVGQWPTRKVDRTLEELSLSCPLLFRVDHVYMISRADFEDPFHIRCAVPLGGTDAPPALPLEPFGGTDAAPAAEAEAKPEGSGKSGGQ